MDCPEVSRLRCRWQTTHAVVKPWATGGSIIVACALRPAALKQNHLLMKDH